MRENGLSCCERVCFGACTTAMKRREKKLVRGYETLSADVQRMMVRIRAIYRAHGIRTSASAVYQEKQREQWLQLLTAPGNRQHVSWLYEELDRLRPLRKQAKIAMVAEGCDE